MLIKKIFFFTFVLIFILTNCKKKETAIEDKKMGLIEDDLSGEYSTHLVEKPNYSIVSPGSNKKLERSFENAPPMISHSVEGFLPINLKNNLCLTCHLPAQAKQIEGSTPMSKSHFTEYRPSKPPSYKKIEAFMHELEDFDRARYNCMQCHVTLTNVKVDIENLFTPGFRDLSGKVQSNLNKVFSEGI